MFEYTEKKLAKDIGKVAASIDSSLQWTYLPDTSEVTLTHSKDETSRPYTVFLGNLFLKVSTMSKKDRLVSIEAFLRDAFTPKELAPEELMASLALRVRTEFEIEFRNRHIELMGHEPPPSISVLRGELLIEVVSDSDESVSVARSDDLAEISVTEDEAIRMAAAKIRRATDQGQWELLEESIWISKYQDDYDFARLVAAEDYGSFPFSAPPIVFAPSHSICLVTDKSDAEILSQMVEIGNDLSASHRSFCQLLWTLKDGAQWKQLEPKETHGGFEIASLQAIREIAKKYEETKDYLERSLGEEVYVGTYEAIQNEDGLICYSVYTMGLPSCLPHTDFVAIVDPDLPESESLVGRVDWYEFEQCCESIEQIENMNPDWYRILHPLDAIQKNRLRQLAQPLT